MRAFPSRTALAAYAPWLLAALLLAALAVYRLERDASRLVARGDGQYGAGKTAEALFSWKVALACRVPFSPSAEAAADRLEAAADRALSEGDGEMGERALGYLRAGLLGNRHLWQPMAGRVARAEARLVALAPAEERPLRAAQLRLRHGSRPAAFPFFLAGMIGWPVSVIRRIRRWSVGGEPFAARHLLSPLFFLVLLAAGAAAS